ncbi:MAG: hypothetical protein QOJ89_4822 [bacterium]|jgi:hypothetical protein
MPRATAASIVLVLASLSLSGCIVNDEPKKPDAAKRNKAVARCSGDECRVRVTCNGRVSVLLGPAPVQIRTSKRVLRTTIVADFAGSSHDQVVRC